MELSILINQNVSYLLDKDSSQLFGMGPRIKANSRGKMTRHISKQPIVIAEIISLMLFWFFTDTFPFFNLDNWVNTIHILYPFTDTNMTCV